MRHLIAAVMIGSACTLVAPAESASLAVGQAPAAVTLKGRSHATTGVVKSIDDRALVITRSGKHAEDMTFGVNAATHRYGAIAAGSPVSVRYKDDGHTHVATAIILRPMKQKGAAG